MIRRVLAALAIAAERLGARIVHFSVQQDHVHLIVEAIDREALSRAMQGLAVRLARTVNRAMDRKGTVFVDRHHTRVLGTPRQVRFALQYVLCNAAKHRVMPRGHRFDPCSSARAFDGWSVALEITLSPCVVPPRIWLLTHGWKKWGPIDPDAVPGAWAG